MKDKSNLYALNEIYFESSRFGYEENLKNMFRVLTAMTGQVQLSFHRMGETDFRPSFVLKPGDSALVPASLAAYRMTPLSVPARILKSYVP